MYLPKATIFAAMLACAATAQTTQTTRRIGEMTPVDRLAAVRTMAECDEFQSKSPCKVTVNMSDTPLDGGAGKTGPLMPRAHWDVNVKPFDHIRKSVPKGEAAVVLTHSSPFLKCTVSAAPSAPGRDLSSGFASLLSTLGGFGPVSTLTGAPPISGPGVVQSHAMFERVEAPKVEPSGTDARRVLDGIEKQRVAVSAQETKFGNNINDQLAGVRNTIKNDWLFTFQGEPDATNKRDDLTAALRTFLSVPPPDLTPIQTAAKALNAALAAFEQEFKPETLSPADRDFYNQEVDRIKQVNGIANLLSERLSDFGDKRKTLRQTLDYVVNLDPALPLTEQVLPMAYFSQKSVTETIACTDAVAGAAGLRQYRVHRVL